MGLLIKKNLLDNKDTESHIIQLVGDRDKPSISKKNIAFTIPANSMSDRGQFVLEHANKILIGDGNLYKNIMKKLNFNMEEIKLFDSFAGIGALHQSLKELGVPTKLVGVSEVDIDAIISYSAIHIDNFKNIPFDYPSDDEMRKVLMDRNIGYDFKKNKSKIPRLNKKKLKSCFKATMLINNLGDIGKLDYSGIPDFDLFNFSFPCTAISVAGKQEGMKKKDGSVTSSGLYIYGIKVIGAKKPKYIMIENVKNLIGKKFINDFHKIINQIEDLGYNCYYPTKEDKKGNKKPTCLNAKDFGIPQNRERIFVICVRKDVDTYDFEFPIGKDYGIRLKDILEDEVNEKYYLSDEIQQRFKFNGNKDLEHNELNVIGSSAPEFRKIGQRDMTYGANGIMSTLTATDYKQPKQIIEDRNFIEYTKQGVEVRQATDYKQPLVLENEIKVVGSTKAIWQKGFDVMNRVYSDEGISPTIDTMQGGNRQPKILDINKLSEDGKTICEQRSDEGLRFFKDNICGTIRTIDAGGDKRVIVDNKFEKMKNPYEIANEYFQNNDFNEPMALDEQNKCVRKDFTVGTLTTDGSSPKKNNRIIVNAMCGYKIRKLTPTECWRLMGFRDEHIHRAMELGISDSQLYKQAGNSIVVNVLYFIFKNLFKDYIK